MTEKTLVKFAQIRPARGGPDWIVGADGGGLVLGKLHQSADEADPSSAGNGAAEIEVWARSARIYEQAAGALAGDTRLLTDPRLSLLLAAGVVMLSGLLAQQQALSQKMLDQVGDKADGQNWCG